MTAELVPDRDVEGRFEAGRVKTAGRTAGTPNKTTAKIMDAMMRAFEEAGGKEYLLSVAKDDPKTFCALLAKLIPHELKEHAERYWTGEAKVLNFLMGQVMRRTEGKANPGVVRELLVRKLES